LVCLLNATTGHEQPQQTMREFAGYSVRRQLNELVVRGERWIGADQKRGSALLQRDSKTASKSR